MNENKLHMVNKLIQKDGVCNTFLDDVKIYKTSKPESLSAHLYDNCIIFVLQNFKKVKLHEKILEYNPKNYLVAASTFPFECTAFPSNDEPLIALVITINQKVMHQVINDVSTSHNLESKNSEIGPFIDKVTPQIDDALYRLLCVLNSKEESHVLGEAIVRELFYRVAKGDNASYLHKLFNQASNEAKVSRSLKVIHNEFYKELNIPVLARMQDMSEASFHTYFKVITGYTPFQYIKKIRLTKAREFINEENLSIGETAHKVGYGSTSQFSREFKKYFGFSPKESRISFEEYSL